MTPYYTDALTTLYLGDCREILPTLQPTIVVTDPPYGQTSLSWDQWVIGWPALVPSTCLWTFGTLRMFLGHALEFEVAGWKFARDLIWEKHNGASFHRDRFRRVHEQLAHFYKGRWDAQQHLVPVTLDARKKQARRKERPQHFGVIPNTTYQSIDGGPRLRRSVIPIRSCHGFAEHPTEKPQELLRLLIEYSCPSEGVVVDPFCGAGSTLLAALAIGRRSIGVEISEEYCERAAHRLAQRVVGVA